MLDYKVYDENDSMLQQYRVWRKKNGELRSNITKLSKNVSFITNLIKRNYLMYQDVVEKNPIDFVGDDIKEKLYKIDTNTLFGEPLFKSGMKIGTGYITKGAIRSYQLGLEDNKYDGVTCEHWFPRTHVGRILVSAAHGVDVDNIFDNNITETKVLNFIEKNIPLFCSVIISSKKENMEIDNVVKNNEFTYNDYINLTHYEQANFEIFRWVGFPKRGKIITTASILGPLKDYSYYYPQVITEGMKNLSSNSCLV